MSATTRGDFPSAKSSAGSSVWRRSIPAQVGGLVIWLVICFGASALGAAATSSSVNGWYQTLDRPSWNPPDWVFGPVWTLLYFLMAVAAWLIWRREPIASSRWPLGLFLFQLALNVGWSVLFFGLKAPGWAFFEIVVLCLAIAATALAFWPRSKVAALLLAPYLAWTTFASVLNFTLWRLNS
jgi:benzodiazapine receptor